ncbi:NUDIX domain-containing protein [Planomonospora sp. ID82291]|uniref:NUDIX domain-containing protein n=1 Tax=Planomonospora sp. ID82291 TaxID=2738136 RepID=UPI0018C3FDE1|nr:NUDIX domain-containing protein [Planomonospora sp. ID82291]MBG0818693.1 NUDIX domain-containing protein [Planomonospora sp. ID82291]
MTETPPVGVELFGVHRLRLTEVAAPRLSPEDELARDRVWDAAVQANPNLFDGPVVACAGLEREGPRSLVLTWARVTYRHYALRQVPGATGWLPSLFVNAVQPTDDGRVLVARMSSSTAAPGRWQLPGGSVEPPQDHEVLDEAALRRHAARELTEETGLDTAPEELTLWAVTRGEHRSVGLVFLAPPRRVSVLGERFAALVTAGQAAGRESELDRIAVVGSAAELANLSGPHADYLEPVVRCYTEQLPGCGAGDPPAMR